MFDANYKQQELYRFLELHYQPTEGYTSKVLVAYNAPFCKKVFNIFYNYQTGKEESLDCFPHVFDGRNAYYITANGFQKRGLRRTNNLFTLHNLVVDIDCHSYGIDKASVEQELNICEEYLREYFNSNLDLPCPNTIVNTGRGFQLWWAILPIPAKFFDKVYEQTADYFCKKIGAILRKCPCLSLIHVDTAASRKVSGLFRLPGTFNRKTRSYGSFEILHEDYLDMVSYFYNHIVEPKYSGLPYKRRKKYSLSEYRTKIINRLVEMRRMEGISEDGYRDLYCFIYFNIRADESTVNKAWKETLEFNARFKHPLSEKKLRSYLSTSMRKIYHFSNKTIISYLNITEKEQRILHFFLARNREEIRQEKRRIKQERNQKIIALANKNLTQREVAELIGCSQATVCRVLKKEAKRLEEIASEHNHNKKSKADEKTEINKKQTKTKNPILYNHKENRKRAPILEKNIHIKKTEATKPFTIKTKKEEIKTFNKTLITRTYCILLTPDYVKIRKKRKGNKTSLKWLKAPPKKLLKNRVKEKFVR